MTLSCPSWDAGRWISAIVFSTGRQAIELDHFGRGLLQSQPMAEGLGERAAVRSLHPPAEPLVGPPPAGQPLPAPPGPAAEPPLPPEGRGRAFTAPPPVETKPRSTCRETARAESEQAAERSAGWRLRPACRRRRQRHHRCPKAAAAADPARSTKAPPLGANQAPILDLEDSYACCLLGWFGSLPCCSDSDLSACCRRRRARKVACRAPRARKWKSSWRKASRCALPATICKHRRR